MRFLTQCAYSLIAILAIFLMSPLYGEDNTPKEKQSIDPEKAFKQRDKNEDQDLSLDEYRSVMKDEAIREKAITWFKARDKDGDDKLSFKEFEAGLKKSKATKKNVTPS